MSMDSATAVDVATFLHGPIILIAVTPFLVLAQVGLVRWWRMPLAEAYMTWSLLAFLGSMFCGLVVYGVSLRMVQASFSPGFVLDSYFAAASGFVLFQHAFLFLGVSLFAVMVLRDQKSARRRLLDMQIRSFGDGAAHPDSRTDADDQTTVGNGHDGTGRGH